MKTKLVNRKGLRDLCNKNGRQISKPFVDYLDRWLVKKIEEICAYNNGGATRIRADLAAHLGLK